jgi:hypothetical protein
MGISESEQRRRENLIYEKAAEVGQKAEGVKDEGVLSVESVIRVRGEAHQRELEQELGALARSFSSEDQK